MSETLFSLQYAKRTCAICGNPRSRLLYSQEFENLSEKDPLHGYDVVACTNCGFCFADRIPGQEVFDLYYRDMSKYEYEERNAHLSKWDVEKFTAIADFIASALSDKKCRVMEIGCANGYLLSLLKQHGFEHVMGVDPSPSCAEAAYRLYGVQVLTHAISDLSAENGSADLIILSGVLEHVRALEEALLKLSQMVSRDGGICVVVPDASRYTQGKDAPFQEFSKEHINFFGSRSLENLMSRYGFSCTICRHVMVQSNNYTSIPIIQAIFHKNNRLMESNSSLLIPDTATERSLGAYIEHSRKIDGQIQAIINEIVDSGKSILVWGTGTLTLRLLAKSRLSEANIIAFIDSNPHYHGKELRGIPIIAPSVLEAKKEAILIATRVYQEEIVDTIRHHLNLSNQLILLFDLRSA